MSFHAASRAVLALGAPQPPLVCVAVTPVREGGCRYCGRARRRSRPPWALHVPSMRPPCVSAAAPNRVLENGHTGETRLALRDPAREPAAPTPWLPVLSLTCSGQACRVSPSSQESEQSPGVQLRPPGTRLSARAERSGAQCRVVGTHCGSGQLGAGFQLPVTGDVPWEGPFTSQVRKEVARLQQRPFPLPHHKSSRPNDA